MNFIKFSQNLKHLRLSHKLTSNLLAKMIGLQGKGSYSKLENAKNPPSFYPLVNTAELFAIDLDWLIGRVSYPYDEEIIFQAEEGLFPLFIVLDGEKLSYFPLKGSQPIPDDYTAPERRKETYSLPLRADILYVAHLMQFLVSENPGVANLPVRTDIPPDTDLYIMCQAWLHEIWENRKREPFDKQRPIFNILDNE